MQIKVYLERKDIVNDLRVITVVLREADNIITNKNFCENYREAFKIKGIVTSNPQEFMNGYLELYISTSEYTTLCVFLEKEV